MPQVVHLVQLPDLAEPGPRREVARLLPCLEARAPLVFPLEERARAKGVSAELVEAAELLRLGRLPEGELLAELVGARLDEREDLVVEELEVALRSGGGEFSRRREEARDGLTFDSLTAFLVFSNPGKPWYSQMWTAPRAQGQQEIGRACDRVRRLLTKSVDIADSNLKASIQLSVELMSFVHLLVVARNLVLVLLDVLRQHLVPCERAKDQVSLVPNLRRRPTALLTLELMHIFLQVNAGPVSLSSPASAAVLLLAFPAMRHTPLPALACSRLPRSSPPNRRKAERTPRPTSLLCWCFASCLASSLP